MELDFYGIILPFSLAVNLQIKDGRKAMLDIKEVAKQWPGFQDKKRAFIGNNWVLEIVMMYYHDYYVFFKLGYINSDLDQFIIDNFYTAIDDY